MPDEDGQSHRPRSDDYYWLAELLKRLIRRPRRGEAPGERTDGSRRSRWQRRRDRRDRRGLPIVPFVERQPTPAGEKSPVFVWLETLLNHPRRGRLPHCYVDYRTIAAAGSPATEDPAATRLRVLTATLLAMSRGLSEARNQGPGRLRFRRFGLVHWLINHEITPGEMDPDVALRQALRARDLLRRGAKKTLDISNLQVAGWLQALVRFLPPLWFNAKVNGWLPGVRMEYRWLLKQPYLAPHDPGTFLGFAERLTKGECEKEDEEQLACLLVNAFLADLRRTYRRFPRFLRSARRTSYPVVLLDGVHRTNDGFRLLDLICKVRNFTGRFDPLQVFTSGTAPRPGADVHPLRRCLPAYEAWADNLQHQRRARLAPAWYLTLGLPASAAPTPQGHLKVAEPVLILRRRVLVPLLVLAVLGGGGLVAYTTQEAREREQAEHCRLDSDAPDFATLFTADGQCVGVSATGFAFNTQDEALTEVQQRIGAQNADAVRLHRENPRRPYLTLAYVSTLSTTTSPPGGLDAQRESLAGIAVGQYRQLQKNGPDDPLVRILIANAGERMGSGEFVAELLGDLAAEDPSLVGVIGLEQSRASTIRTVEKLAEVGLPMISPALSADQIPQYSPMYQQVSPNNSREAAVAAAYARTLLDSGRIGPAVRIAYSSDPDDIYSSNLRDGVRAAFGALAVGFAVEEAPFEPRSVDSVSGSPGAVSAARVGQQACGYRGLVFFAGRPEEFDAFLSSLNDHCRAAPPAILAADDISRFVADPDLRERYPAIPYDYLSFAVGSTHCDPRSDLYSTLSKLFPEECRDGRDPSLDGHAALAYDALLCFLRAAAHLGDYGRGIPLTPGVMWHELSRIAGDSALDGESGRIDFGGPGGAQVPDAKNIVVLRVSGGSRPMAVGACGRHGGRVPSVWCP